jgi:hypothetical protein
MSVCVQYRHIFKIFYISGWLNSMNMESNGMGVWIHCKCAFKGIINQYECETWKSCEKPNTFINKFYYLNSSIYLKKED